MKKYFVLSIVFVVLCLGLCSCVVNVQNNPSMGKVNVIFDLADCYDSGWISIEEITVANDDSGMKYVWDDRICESEGHSFTVKPGYYYVEIKAYSRYSREYYNVSTKRSKYVDAGHTIRAVFDGDRVYFE